MVRIVAAGVAAAVAATSLASPLDFIAETYSDWKERLFGKGHPTAEIVDAPTSGPVILEPAHPVRIRIDEAAPEREFPKGNSRYRTLELPAPLAHAAIRLQVVAEDNKHGRGNVVFKPALYALADGETLRDPVEAKPLHLDIRPFRPTRLLGCVTLDNVQRLALATTPDAIGKSYESEVRESVKAPTQGGFYYATDAVKVRLPWAATGTVIIEVTAEAESGKGC